MATPLMTGAKGSKDRGKRGDLAVMIHNCLVHSQFLHLRHLHGKWVAAF